MQCDFCSSLIVVRLFPCRDFDSDSGKVGASIKMRDGKNVTMTLQSKDFWAACPDCAKLVDTTDIEGLVNQAMKTMHPSPEILDSFRAHLYWTYGLFFQNRLPEVRAS